MSTSARPHTDTRNLRACCDPHGQRGWRGPWYRTLLLVICAVNGLCALVWGVLMMAIPSGEPYMMGGMAEALRTAMPLPDVLLQDLFWPGMALALVNGVPNAVAVVLAVRRSPQAVRMGLAAGILLVAWCAFELAFIPNALSVGYLACGVVQTALGIASVRSDRVPRRATAPEGCAR